MTIAEVSRRFDISPDALRYYERKGLLPEIGRTAGGIRCYSEDDCAWVAFIKCMRAAGVSVETLAEYVRLFRQGPETAQQRRALLIAQRERIERKKCELEEVLTRLDHKIENYDSVILPL